VLRSAVERLPITDPGERDLVLSVMLAREREASTGIGEGIAIPHVRSPLVFAESPAVIAVCYLEHRVPFDAIDGEPVHTVFVMMTPTINAHLQLLSRLSLALCDPAFKAALAAHASIGEARSRGVGPPTALPAGRGSSPVGSLDDLLAHVRRIEAALVPS
jgi:nitrogen PTS system EIIA component